MDKISRFARSMNETHRICTHEISGHLHLVRFCIDELINDQGKENPILNKLEEGVLRLEELNKVWKTCTPSQNYDREFAFEEIVEKGIGLSILYNQKYISDISYGILGDFSLEMNQGIALVEAIYAGASIACHFAIEQNLQVLNFKVTGEKSDRVNVEIFAGLNKVCVSEIERLISTGNDNEKTLRRFIGIKLLEDLGGEIKFISEESSLKIRIKL